MRWIERVCQLFLPAIRIRCEPARAAPIRAARTDPGDRADDRSPCGAPKQLWHRLSLIEDQTLALSLLDLKPWIAREQLAKPRYPRGRDTSASGRSAAPAWSSRPDARRESGPPETRPTAHAAVHLRASATYVQYRSVTSNLQEPAEAVGDESTRAAEMKTAARGGRVPNEPLRLLLRLLRRSGRARPGRGVAAGAGAAATSGSLILDARVLLARGRERAALEARGSTTGLVAP